MPEEKKSQTLKDRLSSMRSGAKKTSEEKKNVTLKDKLNALTFSNRQAGDISSMQSGKSAVKQNIGRKKKAVSSSLSSLNSLKSSLGTQFSSK